jgi:hypothetical protein
MKLYVLASLTLAALAPQVFAGDAELTVDANVAYKRTGSTQCTGQNCTNTSKIDLKSDHTFHITPSEVAQITSATRVDFKLSYLGTLSFNLGEDANYQQGDTSAEVTKTFNFGGLNIPATAQVEWSTGDFHIAVASKATVNEAPIFSTVSERAAADKSSDEKGLSSSPFQIKTTLVDTAPPTAAEPKINVEVIIVNDDVYLAVDRKSSTKGVSTATGQTSYKSSEQVKSQFITQAPPPQN